MFNAKYSSSSRYHVWKQCFTLIRYLFNFFFFFGEFNVPSTGCDFEVITQFNFLLQNIGYVTHLNLVNFAAIAAALIPILVSILFSYISTIRFSFFMIEYYFIYL